MQNINEITVKVFCQETENALLCGKWTVTKASINMIYLTFNRPDYRATMSYYRGIFILNIFTFILFLISYIK